jgi:hypothetical protein
MEFEELHLNSSESDELVQKMNSGRFVKIIGNR